MALATLHYAFDDIDYALELMQQCEASLAAGGTWAPSVHGDRMVKLVETFQAHWQAFQGFPSSGDQQFFRRFTG